MANENPHHKQIAVAFVKHNSTEDFVFVLHDYTKEDAKRFIQRVRVSLTRMRNYVRRKGMAVKSFRMRLVSIECQTEPELKCTVTLRRDEPDAQIARDVANAFADLTNGELVQ